jgi:hypothetical protein
MTFAMPKLRRLKSGAYRLVNAFEKPKRNARAQIFTRNVTPDGPSREAPASALAQRAQKIT